MYWIVLDSSLWMGFGCLGSSESISIVRYSIGSRNTTKNIRLSPRGLRLFAIARFRDLFFKSIGSLGGSIQWHMAMAMAMTMAVKGFLFILLYLTVSVYHFIGYPPKRGFLFSQPGTCALTLNRQHLSARTKKDKKEIYLQEQLGHGCQDNTAQDHNLNTSKQRLPPLLLHNLLRSLP